MTATNAVATDITSHPFCCTGKSGKSLAIERAGGNATGRPTMINRARSRIRARGEHPFQASSSNWGFAKARYQGLTKNLARAHIMFALANRQQGICCGVA